MTPELKSITRYIDRVTVKGSNEPIGLYTIDVNVNDLPPSKIPGEGEYGYNKEELLD